MPPSANSEYPPEMAERNCPKCGNRMEPGFVYDANGERSMHSSWSKQKPKKGVLSYLGLTTDGPSEKDLTPVVTYRCRQCGYLESYAPG